MTPITIIQALKDEQLLRPFLQDKHARLGSWLHWFAALRCLYGLPISLKRRKVVERCTGRNIAKLPRDGFSTALFLTGRRSGKSRIAACIGSFEAVLAGHQNKLAPGECGVVPVICPTKQQGRIVRDYLRAIFDCELFANEVVGETKQGFELAGGKVRIEILAGDFRTVRGYTTLAVICDEIAFMGLDEEARVRSDTELIRAVKPSLATVGGKLIAISSPYARKGWTWKTHQKHFANDAGKVLVWQCGSRTMNPLLPQSVIDDAMAEDPAGARSEYLGEFRDDVGEWLPREVIERLVIPNCIETLPRPGVKYRAFFDPSGGRADDAVLAIGYLKGRVVKLNKLCRWRPPCNPYEVIGHAAEEVKRWGIRKVVGDNYAAEFVARAFEGSGVKYEQCKKNKSQLYGELLPKMTACEVALLDNEALVNQLAGLERRTRSGGKDIIDHPPGGHDDLSNAVAGLVEITSKGRRKVGGWCGNPFDDSERARLFDRQFRS